jgi:transforming growth factor-beta-induced protein
LYTEFNFTEESTMRWIKNLTLGAMSVALLAACADTPTALDSEMATTVEARNDGPSTQQSPNQDGQTIADLVIALVDAGQPFNTLLAAVLAADGTVLETLSGNGQFTVFAPTDDAFAAALEDLGLAPEDVLDNQELVTEILLYHVARGARYASDVITSDQIRMLNGEFTRISEMDGGYYIDDAQIVATDVEASNGVVHVIDYVLVPNDMKKQGNKSEPTLVDLVVGLVEDGAPFETLLAAVLAADPAVAETLAGNGQFTVFAPTDEAFAAIGLDADNVGSQDQGFLTNVLLYHVARGARYAEDVVTSDQIRMLNGEFTSISEMDDMYYINDSMIVLNLTDIPARNGVVHVIDAVLLPGS